MAATAQSLGVVAFRRHLFLRFFFFSFLFLLFAHGFSPASGRGRLRGGRQGVRGASPSTPPTTPVLPLVRVAEGATVACRIPCPPLAAGGKSARIFPLRGRYARLLRRSRVAGIASAPRLAGLVGIFWAFALKGGERSPLFVMQRKRWGTKSF